MTVRRSVVVPMFRESRRIEATAAAFACSPLNRPEVEVLFVDDGSDDGTADVAERAIRAAGLVNARVLRCPSNQGKGGAVREGVLASTGAVVAFADADLAAGVDEIQRCLEEVEATGADVVFTTRLHDDSVITRPPPWSRRLAGKAFNLWLRGLRMTGFADTQCGLKAFTRSAALTLFTPLRVRRFAFDVELLHMAGRCGLRVHELPITWHHVDASHVRTFRDGMRMVFDTTRLWWATRRGAAPGAAGEAVRPMEAEQFEVIARVEAEHWWWRAKRALVAHELRRPDVPLGAALDVGCGTGETASMLSGAGFKPVIGSDVSRDALTHADARLDPAVSLLMARAEHLPVPSGSLACLTSLDVVEHVDDDVGVFREYARAVEPGGVVVVTVPAYQWAWSAHDEALGHRRRYTARTLRAAAEAAGLHVERCDYFHSWLVPAALLVRRTPLRRLVRGTAEEASLGGPLVNRWLGRLTRVEAWLGRRVRLPFGLSVLMVARGPGDGARPSR